MEKTNSKEHEDANKPEEITEEERKLLENINSPVEKAKRGRKKKIEDVKGRERANSLSIIELLKGNGKENTLDINKRKREDIETEAKEVFKRSNKMERTPTKEKDEQPERTKTRELEGEEEKEASKKDEENVVIMILREIKDNMFEMRREMSEMKERIDNIEKGKEMRVKRVEDRLDKIELKIKEIEDKKTYHKAVEEETGEEREVRKIERQKENHELKCFEDTKKEVKKLKKIIEDKERKEKKNNIVIRGLKSDTKNVREVGREFVEKEFSASKAIKNIRKAGREDREVVIIEFEDWREKENIMKEKGKLRGRSIYIEHDLTREERDIQWKLRERAKREKEEGKKVKVGYRKIVIDGKVFFWNEEEEDIKERIYERRGAEEDVARTSSKEESNRGNYLDSVKNFAEAKRLY